MSDLETKAIKKLEWGNTDMVDFYENIPVEVLRGYATIGGFEDGCDIDLAYPYIAHTQSLIEAGAAYGRVIKNLLRKKYAGKICAIERSKNFCNYLKEHYQDKAEIINVDVMHYEPPQKVDAALWMWSNISEFPKEDQLKALGHITSFIKSDGLIILETISHTILPKNVTYHVESQTYIEDSQYGMAYGYTPTIEEIHRYGEELRFLYMKHIEYETTTKRPRVLHILSRKKLSI